MPRHKLPALPASVSDQSPRRRGFRSIFNGIPRPDHLARYSYRGTRAASVMREKIKWNNPFVKLLHPRSLLRSGRRMVDAGWREAFDEEGSRGRRILRIPLPRSNHVVGAIQMSVAAASKAHGPVIQCTAPRGLVSHSFSFFTGLCEKFPMGVASPALLAGCRKRL